MKYYNFEQVSLNNNSPWMIKSYVDYIDYIKQNDPDFIEFKKITSFIERSHYKVDFKWNIEIGSMQFLIGVFPSETKILIASKHLNNELSILQATEIETNGDLEELKDFSEKIAQINVFDGPSVIEMVTINENLANLDEKTLSDVYKRSVDLSQNLIIEVSKYKQSFFEKFSDFGLDLTANFMLIRIHLLKFLAILPNLDHDKNGHEVKRILIETFNRLINDSALAEEKKYKGQKRPIPSHLIFLFKIILTVAEFLPAGVLAGMTRFAVKLMAKRFIAGENIQNASSSLSQLFKTNRDATIDQLGELVVSNKEADIYTNEVLSIIDGWKGHISVGERNTANILKAHVSIKVSALANDFKPQDYNYTYSCVAPRLRKILLSAKENQVFINIDAEHFHYRDTVFQIYRDVLLNSPEFKDYQQTGIVIQAYLRDGAQHMREVSALAVKRGLVMPIRLVKGAYWDAETIEADAHSFDAPEFLNKEETDQHFRQLMHLSLEDGSMLQLTVASHNIQDHCFAESLRELKFPNAPVIEHQCLHMTYEGLSTGLALMGWPTRNYIPVGNLLVGMAYLVRRIMENSSQVGVLTIMRSHKKNLNYQKPMEILVNNKENLKYKFDQSIEVMSKDFRNIYPIRTYQTKNRLKLRAQVDKTLSNLEKGQLFYDNGLQDLYCNSNPSLKLGRINYDTKEEVKDKIELLFKGFNETNWSSSLLFRTITLKKLSDLLLMERENLTSLIIFEAGKTVDEAIGDVDEAIDFINFYIDEQVKLLQLGSYSPKGVIGVIAPWNFPLAIPCGMTVAGLVAGNTVILKPAEQTPLIGLEFHRLSMLAGIPQEVFQLSLGDGEVGKEIVSHELISGIVFTGSKDVGTEIFKKISVQMTSKRYSFSPIPKFAITEMGGKNAVIVTNNSELDETVSGIIYSSFAHAGQKCSASSRIIIDEQIKDSFIARFTEAVKDLKVGPSYEFSTLINPLASLEDKNRVISMSKTARKEVEEFGGTTHVSPEDSFTNYCVAPHVFELDGKTVLENDTIASKEVFGPIVHIISYKTIDEAITIFNSTQYALTGGIYCQSQDDLNYLIPKLEVGNLYINRPNTGARVAIEPFGGFKMSGTGPKAGSQSYLFPFNRVMNHEAQIGKDVYFTESFDKLDHLASPSGLNFYKRKSNVLVLLGYLINQFESIFGAITEMEKYKLELLNQAIIDGEFDFETKEFPNRYIPGQLSFNKRDMILGNGILIDSSNKLEVRVVIDLMINLLIGNGVNIFTTNEDISEGWTKIYELSLLSGFSQYNLTFTKGSRTDLIRLIDENIFQFIIFSRYDVSDELKKSIYEKDFHHGLTKVIYSGFNETWNDAIESFTQVRSIAINTMRHGAPLELTL